MRCIVLHSAEAFDAMGARWDALTQQAGAGLFLSHRWLSAWWHAYHGIDELWTFLVEDEAGELVAGWPLHLRAPRSGALRVAELRLVGDLGGAERSMVCRPGGEPEVAQALSEALLGARSWDLVDVPVRPALEKRLAEALSTAGAKFDRMELQGRSFLDLPERAHWEEFARARRTQRTIPGAVYATANIDVPHALDELLRLLRKEWAAREATSPAADPQAVAFLQDIVPELHARDLLRIGVVALEGVGAIAADLVVTDGDRAVQLLRGADPEHQPAGVADQLTWGSIEAAQAAGARRFEFAEDELPWRATRTRVTRLRLWNATAAGRLHRGMTALSGAMRALDLAPPRSPRARTPSGAWRALEKLRTATPEVVKDAVARVATYSTLHLYRGELFARNVRESGELTLTLFERAEFDALSEPERERYVTRLDLQEAYCGQKWERGDTVVLARAAGEPAGILWCARAPVYVPDIGREVRPAAGECYIHDVYVHPDERGRQVAPAMLDFLARELRRRDVYRAWALIERTNVASTRAFEKAAYASVADVIYVRMGLASRLIVRPPDPEARALLGLP